MNPLYTIRAAQVDDLDRLTELHLSLQDHLEQSNPDLWRMKRQARGNLESQLAARLRADNGCALVAAHGEKGVVGMIFGRIVTNNRYHPSRAGLIDQLYVDEHHRRAGLGSQLVRELCRFFFDQEVDDLSLRYVVGNDEAAGFWTTLGFTPRIVTAGIERQALETHF